MGTQQVFNSVVDNVQSWSVFWRNIPCLQSRDFREVVNNFLTGSCFVMQDDVSVYMAAVDNLCAALELLM